MINDKYGQVILNQDDVIDLIMKQYSLDYFKNCLVDESVNEKLIGANQYQKTNNSIEEFDSNCQQNWFMPQKYHSLDIVEYILDKCKSDKELERVGMELITYQEKNLLNLLRYLVYLVDTMIENKIIWGVGRGSSVSSYVLYLIGIHKIDSIEYDLDYRDFLR
jgi:DNA polymerase III alpha subunit